MKPIVRVTLQLVFVFGIVLSALQPGRVARAAGPAVTDANPVIDIWYGPEQSFGHHGQPQRQVNILGNVSDADGIKSLTYSLNGVSQGSLSMGPDTRRLLEPGDFVVELYYEDLDAGDNMVVITAVDTLNNTTSEPVTVNIVNGSSDIPSTIDWRSVTHINDLAQVVDGKWSLSGSSVRTVQVGYDRLIAVGEMDWTDFEVSVPITVHGIDEEYGFDAPSYGPAVGLILGWTGHTDSPDVIAGKQPHEGYLPYGAIGVYRWMESDHGGNRLRLYLNDRDADDNVQSLSYGVTYIFKMRMQAEPGQGQSYRFKIWNSGQTEPASWTLSGQGDLDDPQSGCIVLMSHHVDAAFGNVTITDLNDLPTTYTLGVAASEHGSVSVNPDKPAYSDGESVTLTATPDPGWLFGGWTVNGVSKGSTNPYTFEIQGNTTVAASFTQTLYTLSAAPVGQGTVSKYPDSGTYPSGSKVTLAANPDPGWVFTGWGGDLSDSANPVEVIMTKNMAVTAAFTQSQYGLAVDTAGQGSVSLSPAKDAYGYGEKVTLTAVPAAGWSFSGWSGAGCAGLGTCTVTMDGDKTVTASFTRNQYRLAVNTLGEGSVSLSPVKDTYGYGEKVTLTAEPAAGWDFLGWGGDISGSANPMEVVVSEDLSIDAVFIQSGVKQYKLSFNTVGAGTVVVDPAQEFYLAGDQVVLTPVPAPGWVFAGWSGDLSGKTSRPKVTIEKDLVITATFARGVFIPFVIGPP